MSTIFPKEANKAPLQVVIALLILGGTITAGFTYYFTPKYARVGYQPVQPVPFDHSLHAGELGLDCRYCHNNVEQSGHSNVPSTSTCMNCHSQLYADSPTLETVRHSYREDQSIQWNRVHDLPDFVYFDHSIHVAKGMACVTCHGPVDRMALAWKENTLKMEWCLDCHRNPQDYVRPREAAFLTQWDTA